ncbi:O-antigen ligase RfaL [Proteus terrae subsp. cibarius]|uniref:O-antigen ligase RfaL n=1 Tax=Proteus terrae subsp. cibarius TaxID=626774 RepID=A0ABX6JQW7_9GAMM|nr:O-antigen ligase RfaL [Proteus terrae]QGW01501.1 O-antigen ligase RfaL [Proteus terrae subsp. cibarius]QIF91479.1 O-antigen ligase RfaL [Proteus terrae subsp. cibarius]
MMLFKDYSKKSLWNLSIIGLYIILIYLPDITRYKNIVMGLIGATALWYLVRDFKAICKIFKNNLSFSLLFLLLVIGYSIVISVEPSISIKEINKPIFNGLLLFAITFPIVLYKEKPTDIAKMVMVAFAIGLLVIMAKELVQYYLEYPKVTPFSWWSQKYHREGSYGLLFFFPIILSYWALTKYYSLTNLVLLILISIVFILLIIGTLSRGVWFTLIIIYFFVTIINQQWRIIITGLISCLFLFSIAILVLPSQPINKMLLNKFTQINSGKRFEGGTQGSALDLILEQPIKGYGYGNQLYHNVYNERVKDHKNWIFKKSIGPHNVFLAFWFAGGILGLFGILYFCSSIIAQGIQLIRKNQGVIRQASLILLMSFLGVYVLRGLFENAYINQVGILVGLMLALRHSLLNYQSVTSSDKQQ